MDLVSHSAVGIGITAIATSKPEIMGLQDSDQLVPFMILMIIASNLPDLDGVFKIFGNETFLRVHRGFSHSVFVALTTAIGLGALSSIFITNLDVSLLIGMTMLATATHLVTDLTNNYGIQIAWPLNKIWFRLSITNTADTLILVSHAIGISIAWPLFANGHPVWPVFTVIYSLMMIYWVILYYVKRIAIKRVKEKYAKNKVERVYVASRSEAWNWKYICKTKSKTYIGYVSKGKVKEIRTVKRGIKLDSKTEEMLMANINFKSFTEFSPIYKIESNHIKGKKTYYVKDLRYFDKKGKFFFTLNVHVEGKEVKKTSLSWSKSKDKRIAKMYGQ